METQARLRRDRRPDAQPHGAPGDAQGSVGSARDAPCRGRSQAPERAAVPRVQVDPRHRRLLLRIRDRRAHVRRVHPRAALRRVRAAAARHDPRPHGAPARGSGSPTTSRRRSTRSRSRSRPGLGFDAALSYFVRQIAVAARRRAAHAAHRDPDGRGPHDGPEEPVGSRPVRGHAQLRPDARPVGGRRDLPRQRSSATRRARCASGGRFRPRSAPRRHR